MRRDANDKEWQAVKQRVRDRDKTDRIFKVISLSEASILKKKAGVLLNVLDPAHYIPVSAKPELCYKSYNIILLNRYSHDNLDHSKDPITGEFITREQTQKWWERLLKGNISQFNYLKYKNLI